MSDLLSSILDLFRILGPVQTIICLIAVVASIWLWAGLYRTSSFNPRHHTDEYVKSHMGEFYSWFESHPEDRAHYEGLPSRGE